MTALPREDVTLGRRLRELRESSGMTQRQVADALGGDRPLSPPLISSWESGKALPQDRWLTEYARVFGAENATTLEAELVALRAAAPRTAAGAGETEPDDGLGSFWRFPDGLPVRIVGTPMFDDVLEKLEYADRWHPNYMRSLHYADMDATIELLGHIRAANPASDVRWLTHDRLGRDDIGCHLVLLGGADSFLTTKPTPLSWYKRRLDLPVGARLPEGGNPEFDSEFVVTVNKSGQPDSAGVGEEVYRPTFLHERDGSTVTMHGYPQLEYDLGLLARQANPMNLGATVTICSGIFSRGTYGVVRALTEKKVRIENEQFLRERFGTGDFWLITRIPVMPRAAGLDTVAPDLTREYHLVRASR